MSAKKEVRELRRLFEDFAREVRDWMQRVSVGNKVYMDIIEKQEVQLDKFADRLLARNLPELKTYTIPDTEVIPQSYDALEDEDLAGEVLAIERDEN